MVRHLSPAVAPLAAALLLACVETITEVSESTFEVSLEARGNFVERGWYLVGDVVTFEATVTENGRPFQPSGARYRSSAPDTVQILDASTGEAAFRREGKARITVVFAQPEFVGADSLSASLNVTVNSFDVALALESTVTGASVAPDDALLGDTVQIVPTVTLGGETIPPSGLTIESAEPSDMVDLSAGGSDVAALIGTGQVTLNVALEQPDIPGSEPLRSSLQVTIRDFAVEIDVQSLVSGSTALVDGDTLVTDSVRFSATVLKEGIEVPTTGASWSSSDPSVVRIVDPATGHAVFDATGEAQVSVTFEDPQLPGVQGVPIRVTTFVPTLTAVSRVTSDVVDGDALVTDSVTFGATVTKDGEPRTGVVVGSVASSDPSVIEIVDPATGAGVFPDTGTAQVSVTLQQPTLPRETLVARRSIRVTTYLVSLSDPVPANPVMGDVLQYSATVTDTRDNTEVSGATVSYASSNPDVIQIVDASSGLAFARDTGQARTRVTLVEPSLPLGEVADTLAPLAITEERFYGTFSKTSGDFGASVAPTGDPVTVDASAVHGFTDTTRIEFPDGAVAFIDALTPTQLTFLVPAAADTGQLVFRNLVDDNGGFRDNVLTRIVFEGPGSAVVDDYYEPNDAFPLTAGVDITPPSSQPLNFAALLSHDPGKTAPADSNFFYLTVPSAEVWTVDILAEWQIDADIDFKVCNASGFGDPPTGYDPSLCPRPPENNGTDPRREEEIGLTLSTGRYIIGFYCKTDACPAPIPLTYKVTIVQR